MSAYYRFSYGVEYAVCLFHSIKQLNASERHTLESVFRRNGRTSYVLWRRVSVSHAQMRTSSFNMSCNLDIVQWVSLTLLVSLGVHRV